LGEGPGRGSLFIGILFITLFGLVGCLNQPASTPAPIVPTLAPFRTLVPTFTPLPNVAQLTTPTPDPNRPQPTAAPSATPIDFEARVIEFRLIVPAIGLDRRLEANVASQITIVDEMTQTAVQRANQASIVLELQNNLPELDLQPIPDGCASCVYFEYSLPFSDASGQGWLQDPIILASIENYLAVAIGPHFPPDTLVGLRRAASAYYPAHTMALMPDGRLFTWLATEAQISEPVSTTLPIASAIGELAGVGINSQYLVQCPAEPIETLYIGNAEESIHIAIRCPAFSLPTTLQPLYLLLNATLTDKLAEAGGPPRPPDAFPLDAVLDYKRLDDRRLTMFADGRILLRDQGEVAYSGTISSTQLLSITTDLLDSGLIQPGLSTFFDETTPEAPTSLLLVRGPDGVWDSELADMDLPELTALNDWIATYLLGEPEPTATPEGTPDANATPDAEATPGTEGEATPSTEPEPTATPTS
jgi:hypothetical protein